MGTGTFLSLAAGLALLAPRAAWAQDDEELPTVARILVTSGVAGHLARPVCTDGVTFDEAPFSRLAPRLFAEEESSDRPMILDSGGLLTPGGVARFAAEREPMELAATIDALGYRALVFSSSELAAPRAPMLRALAALRGRGIPTLATNLFCEPSARALCEVLVDGTDGISMHRVGARRVGLVSFLAQDALQRVAPDRAEGIRIAPIAASMAEAVRRARDQGAEMVVATVDPGDIDDPTARVLELVDSIPMEDRPDLLFSSRSTDVLFGRPMGFRPAVVGSPPTGAVRVRVRHNPLAAGGYDVLASPLAPSRGTDERYESYLRELGRQYCDAWGSVLPGGTLSETPDGTTMLELAAGVVRQVADAEIALLNRGLLDARWHPARDRSLTASDVFVALQYDEPLMVAEVEGSWLKELAGRLDEAGLVALGLEKDGDDVRVNGRPLEDRGVYRVATIRFLASGGDEALPGGADWRRVEGETLRAAVLDVLRQPRDVDPREDLYDPAQHMEWTFRLDGDLSFAGTAVRNEDPDPADPDVGPYEAAQLNRANTNTFGLQSTLRANGLSRYWAWENEGIARYRTTTVDAGDYAEGDDLLSVRSTAFYRGLRLNNERWYIPEPFVEGYLESEFTVPRDSRDYRHLLVRPTAGVRFTLTQHLKLKLLGGAEYETLDPQAEPEPGGGAQLRLEPWNLIDDGVRKVHLEMLLDYFVTPESQTLRGNLDAVMDVTRAIQLVLGLKIYGQKDPGIDIGWAADATAAIRVSWLGRAVP